MVVFAGKKKLCNPYLVKNGYKWQLLGKICWQKAKLWVMAKELSGGCLGIWVQLR